MDVIPKTEVCVKNEDSSINTTHLQMCAAIDIKSEFPAAEFCMQIKQEAVATKPECCIKSEIFDVKTTIKTDVDEITIKLEPLLTEELEIKDESIALADTSMEVCAISQLNVYKCNLCNYETMLKCELKWHVITHTSSKIFYCDKCEYKCRRKHHLRLHTVTHTKETHLKCEVCDYRTTQKYRMHRHMITHTGEKPFKCNLCDYKTAYKRNVQKHEKSHTSDKLFKCNECEYRTLVKHNFEMHAPTHKQASKSNENNKTGIKTFKCKHCEYKTMRKQHIKQHLVTHNSEKIFKCHECNYRTSYKCSYENHKKMHATGKYFMCNECNYRTAVKRNFDMHVPTHNTPVALKDVPNRITAKRIVRKNKEHKMEPKFHIAKSFKCERCNYETAYKHNLQRHVNNHAHEKLFKCGKCKYRTRAKHNFEMHLPTHDAYHQPRPSVKNVQKQEKKCTKLFKCDKCGYRTIVKRNFDMHVPTHSEEPTNSDQHDTFKCNECTYKTTVKCNFEMHIHTVEQHSSASVAFSKPVQALHIDATADFGSPALSVNVSCQSVNLNQGFLVVDPQQMLNSGYCYQMPNLNLINYVGYYP